MKIVRYEEGEQASHDVDCIKLEEQADGSWNLIGSALHGDESVAMVGSQPYASYNDAEAAGLAWASDLRVREIHLEVSRSC